VWEVSGSGSSRRDEEREARDERKEARSTRRTDIKRAAD
jgi:hypothetical protein